MLHSCYIIDLNKKESLSVQFWPRIKQYNQLLPIWPKDDVIYFSGMAKLLQIDLWVDAAVGNGWFPVPVQTGVVHNDGKNNDTLNSGVFKKSDFFSQN
jgi:hypothetical protein